MPASSEALAVPRVRGPGKPRVEIRLDSGGVLWDDAQVATRALLSLPTIKRWRKAGKIPGVVSLNGRPRYRAADVLAWLNGDAIGAKAA
jgi:hypothetical protein